MANINDYFKIIEDLSKSFQGVGHAIRVSNPSLKENVYIKEYVDKTSRIFRLKKNKFNKFKRKFKKIN